MKYFKLISFTLLMFLITWLLMIVADNPIFNFTVFDNNSLNHSVNYQLSGLVLAGVTLVLVYLFADKIRLSYLNFNRKGRMKPSILLGTNNENQDHWETTGRGIGIIMIAIMGITAFFQARTIGFDFRLINLLMAIPLSASNAFTEEVIFRLSYVTVGENETTSSYGLIMGSVVFGIIHYWGVAPNGIIGVLMSAYLGYFLSKSVSETKGFYWAFMIHFFLDVVILIFILNVSA